MPDGAVDTLHRVETPEGVELDLQVAGPVPRALAWALDALIRFAIYMAVSIALSPFEVFGFGLFLIILFLVEWFYPVIGEVMFNGATPGKRAQEIRVLHDDGRPVGWSASLTRNLLRFVDFLPVFYGFGLVSCLLTGDFKRLGDLAAGTIVVYQDSVEFDASRPKVGAQPPPVPLSSDEQQVLVAFAERRPTLTLARARELAEVAGPLVSGSAAPEEDLAAMANWIAGQR
jgi:uncharacterized RDD family membrane protein YckC